MSGDLLLTKLFVPPLRAAFVPRPRLIEQINRGLDAGSRLTLVSAPAGFGKTTLVADWLSHFPADGSGLSPDAGIAWLSLDEEDNDPSRFLLYLTAGLQRLDSNIGGVAAVMLRSPQPPAMESVLTSLLNNIFRMEQADSTTRPNVLVLDDYHLISAGTSHDAVTFLLEKLPPNLHLALITRSDPPLPLSRFRVRGQVCEIRQADLQFTVAEATRFLNDVMGLSLLTSQVETLEVRTEGWIAGLQLAALSLQGRDEPETFVAAFSGSHRFVMDYLVDEVLHDLPEALQRFVLRTAILGRLNGSLCEAVTGQQKGQESLEQLEEDNLFLIPLDDNRVWFRYHHLFADVLASRLQRFSPEQIPELHLRAAKWFQQHNLFSEAIEHALAAHDHQLAAQIVESQGLALLKAGDLATLMSWLHRLPPALVAEHPRLAIASAWVYLLTGHVEPVAAYLEQAESKLDLLENGDDLRGEIAAIRTYSAAILGLPEQAIGHAEDAFALLAKDNLSVRCVVAFVVGGVYYMQQNLPRAMATMQHAGEIGEQAGNLHLAVSAYSSVGDLQHRQGNLAESEKGFYHAMQLSTAPDGTVWPIAASVYSGLAALRLTQKDLPGAREYIMTGLQLGEKWVNADSQVGCYLTLAQLECLEGNHDAARDALAEAKQLAANHQLAAGLDDQIAAVEIAICAPPVVANDPLALNSLSDHELKVLRLIAAGLSNREVAEELYLSINTVKWHLKHIYEKLDVHSRVAAVTSAQELGLL